MFQTLLLLPIIVCFVEAYPTFQPLIPNGPNVPNPCEPNTTWPGVGHKLVGGTGDRNPFGIAFASNGFVWNPTLCRLDSDGDGRTNGQELGDPNCTWSSSSSQAPTFTTGLSHPGVCEPLSSPTCLALNQSAWLSCKQFSCPAFSLPSTQNISLTLPRTPIPVQRTTYMCQAFKLPNDTNYHLIGVKPLLNNTNLVHHMVLFGCPSGVDASISFTKPATCGMSLPGCLTVLVTWSVGIDGICLSDAYGLPIGHFGMQYAVLQVHWNNAALLTNQYDNSGLTLFYTSQLRPNNGQILLIGQEYLNIPPNQQTVPFTGSCPSQCTQNMPYNVNIAAAFLHMHLLGNSGDIYVKSGTNTTKFLTSSQYDYNAPPFISYDPPVQFSVGNEIGINCVYNSIGRNTTTIYGPATTDEMCYGFITIYPEITGFTGCVQYQGDLEGCLLPDLVPVDATTTNSLNVSNALSTHTNVSSAPSTTHTPSNIAPTTSVSKNPAVVGAQGAAVASAALYPTVICICYLLVLFFSNTHL